MRVNMFPSPFKVKFGFIFPLEKSFKLKKFAIVVNLFLSGMYSPKGTNFRLLYILILSEKKIILLKNFSSFFENHALGYLSLILSIFLKILHFACFSNLFNFLGNPALGVFLFFIFPFISCVVFSLVFACFFAQGVGGASQEEFHACSF